MSIPVEKILKRTEAGQIAELNWLTVKASEKLENFLRGQEILEGSS